MKEVVKRSPLSSIVIWASLGEKISSGLMTEEDKIQSALWKVSLEILNSGIILKSQTAELGRF